MGNKVHVNERGWDDEISLIKNFVFRLLVSILYRDVKHFSEQIHLIIVNYTSEAFVLL